MQYKYEKMKYNLSFKKINKFFLVLCFSFPKTFKVFKKTFQNVMF